MKIYRAAFVGCGVIADQHAAALQATPNGELTAVCDVSPITARTSASRLGAMSWHVDHRTMLESIRPDVVHVLTPPQFHQAVTIDALRSGAHVVCEKPITFTTAQLHEVLDAASTAHRQIIESHNYGFNDEIRALDDHLAAGRLGRVIDVEVTIAVPIHEGRFADPASPFASFPAGAIHDFITHMVYLGLRFFPGEEPEFVQSKWRNLSGVPALRYDDLVATVTMPSGSVRLRFSSHFAPISCRIVVHGTKGQAETDLYRPYQRAEIERPGGKLGSLVNHAANGAGFVAWAGRNFRNKLLDRGTYHGMPRMVSAFYASLDGSSPTPVPHEIMLRTSHVIDALVAGAT